MRVRGKPVSCCFTGHRPAKLPWGTDEGDERCLRLKARLREVIARAVEDGYTHFICGMAEGCDLYCAEAVLALRERHSEVTLEAAIPCPTQADGWSAAQPLHGRPFRPAHRCARRSARRHALHHRIRPAPRCEYHRRAHRGIEKGRRKAVLFCFLYTSNTPMMAMPTTTRAIIA